MTLLDHALRYAAARTPIVPCIGKVPPLSGWQQKGSTDADQVRAWWSQWPEANIGGLGGYRHVPLDVDGEEGREALRRLEAEHGPLPPTATVASGRDGYGRHYWFTCPDGTGFWTPAPGLEVRGVGHQTLLPPSRHPDTGREYTWLDTRQTAPLPGWLRTSARQPAPRGDAEVLVPIHQRHHVLTRFLGAARSLGFGEAALIDLTTVYLDRCVEVDEQRCPLDRARAYATARDIARRYPPHRNNGTPRHAEFAARWATPPEEEA